MRKWTERAKRRIRGGVSVQVDGRRCMCVGCICLCVRVPAAGRWSCRLYPSCWNMKWVSRECNPPPSRLSSCTISSMWNSRGARKPHWVCLELTVGFTYSYCQEYHGYFAKGADPPLQSEDVVPWQKKYSDCFSHKFVRLFKIFLVNLWFVSCKFSLFILRILTEYK